MTEINGGIEVQNVENQTVEVPVAVTTRTYTKRSLEERAEIMAQKAVNSLFREQNGLAKRGAFEMSGPVAEKYLNFTAEVLPETKQSILAQLQEQKAAKPKKVREPRGPKGPNLTPGHVFVSGVQKKRMEDGSLSITIPYNGENGNRLVQTYLFAVGKKNPNGLVSKKVE